MNKKFSTLLASVLLTSAFSTTAHATLTEGVDKDLKGKTVALFTEAVASNVVSLTGTNALSKVAKETAFLATYADGAFKTANSALWTIADVKFDQTTGVGIYQFVNKQTGAYLAINLETDNNGSSSVAAKLNGAGNKNWSITSDGVLYAYAKDSIYTLVPGAAVGGVTPYSLKATPGNALPAAGSGLSIFAAVPADTDADLTLTAEAFNAMLAQSASDGKLHFNSSKDVTDGQENLLTAKKYVAYKEGTDPTNGFFLAEKDNETGDNKNPYLLMVDTLFHNASAARYNKLKLDTLSVDKENAAKIKAGTYKTTDYKPTYDKYARPINASIFNATYYYAKDSIALNVAGKPQKLAGDAVFTDGKATRGNASALPNADAVTADKEFIKSLIAAVAKWYAKDEGKPATPFASTNFKIEVKAKSTAADEGTAGAIKFGESYFTIDTYAATVTADLTGTDIAPACTEAGAEKYTATYYRTGSQLAAAAQAEADALTGDNKTKTTEYIASAKGLIYFAADANIAHYFVAGAPYKEATDASESAVLTELAGTRVLTVKTGTTAELLAGYILPLIQPFASAPAGDAEITSDTKLFFIQEKNVGHDASLRATTQTNKYLIGVQGGSTELAEEVSNENPYAQWAFIPSAVGSYSIVNRATGYALYSGMVSKVKDADGNVVADTYVAGADTLKLATVDLSGADIHTEDGTKYDYTGYFYAGPQNGKVMSFEISPVSPFMSTLALQVKADSSLVLGDAVEAPVWYFEEKAGTTYGLTISGMPQLKSVAYKVYMKDAEGTKYFIVADGTNDKFVITKEDSRAASAIKALSFRTIAKDTYLISDGAVKMTINPTPEKPNIEATDVANNLKNDYFTVGKASVNIYRTLTAEDGVNGNAAIYMNNEDSRYLYENSANIVANNGNKVAKDSLNFLGIFNAFELDKNPTLYVDTAYVEREGNIMPQYMFAVGVEEVEAHAAIPCTEGGVHVDKDGKATTADKCVHATPATKGYKAGRYLVSVADSAALYAKHPANYDNTTRFAFVPAKHYFGEDSLVIDSSKYAGTTNAKNDTLKIADNALNEATFALLIKDQADKSFYLQTKGGYVRILNGVPVITANIEDAAIFNIEASELEATANEAIEASQVTVIGGQGVVTVQGVAGKVITVANILGQTIANQVAASDNVTIAAPAGVVVVAVEGDATKVVVK